VLPPLLQLVFVPFRYILSSRATFNLRSSPSDR
jgi:hypothetical protein